MTTYTITSSIPFDEVHAMFSNVDILDAVHGRGLWHFSNWDDQPDGTFTRTGWVDGVQVPTFVRFLNKGKKYVRCNVAQRYVPGESVIEMSSTTVPSIIGGDIATNESHLTISPYNDGCLIRGRFVNSTSLPHPLGTMAIEVMNDMSLETVEFFKDAVR